MFETFFILMAITFIGVFVCEALKSAGEALTSPPKRSTETPVPKCNSNISQAFSPEESAKKLREELQQMEQERKLREQKSWEEFPEKYKGAVCDEEMKAILDLAHKENKTKEEELILLFAKLQVEDLYRKKKRSGKLN